METALLTVVPRLSFDETGSAVVLGPTYPVRVSRSWDALDVVSDNPSDPSLFADVVPDRSQCLEDFDSSERTFCIDYLRIQSKTWLAGKTRLIHDALPPVVTGIVAVTIATWYFTWPIAFGLAYVAGMLSCAFHQIMFELTSVQRG